MERKKRERLEQQERELRDRILKNMKVCILQYLNLCTTATLLSGDCRTLAVEVTTCVFDKLKAVNDLDNF